MAIVAKCDCGKRITLADVMAGRTVRCPSCDGDVFVPAGGGGGGGAAGAPKKKPASNRPEVAISPTIKIGVIVGAVLVVILAIFYFRPWRVGRDWNAMSDKANDQVTDVVLFAIQAYESQNGMFDPRKAHRAPQVDGPCNFVPPYGAFTMPARVPFIGKSNRGNYQGTYSPRTGEISADIEVGGYSFAGLVDIKKATGKFHITGRERDNKPEAEMDGTPMAIVTPKTPDDPN